MKLQTRNRSGKTGVFFYEHTPREGAAAYGRWVAAWIDQTTGKNRSKSFSVKKYGAERAKALAEDYRNRIIR